MIELKQLKNKLEKDFGWENLESDDNKWFVDNLLKDTIQAINVIQCCTQLKDKEALSFDGFKSEFYYKAQMGIYESKATGMFYNLTDLEKRYKKYCERF